MTAQRWADAHAFTDELIGMPAAVWPVPLWTAGIAVRMLPEELHGPVVEHVAAGALAHAAEDVPVEFTPRDLLEESGRSTDPAAVRSVLRIVLQAVEMTAWDLLDDPAVSGPERMARRRRVACAEVTAEVLRRSASGGRLHPVPTDAAGVRSPGAAMPPLRGVPQRRTAGARGRARSAAGRWDADALAAEDWGLPVPPWLWCLACPPLPEELDGLCLMLVFTSIQHATSLGVGSRFTGSFPAPAHAVAGEYTSDPATVLGLAGLGAAGGWALAGLGRGTAPSDPTAQVHLAHHVARVLWTWTLRQRAFGSHEQEGPEGHPLRVLLEDRDARWAALMADVVASLTRWAGAEDAS